MPNNPTIHVYTLYVANLEMQCIDDMLMGQTEAVDLRNKRHIVLQSQPCMFLQLKIIIMSFCYN